MRKYKNISYKGKLQSAFNLEWQKTNDQVQ